MIQDYPLENLVKPALDWYEENRRVLPWREDKNPYKIWVSEIMLQQTRVEAVIPYYQRFMKELPTIEALAYCSEDKLLKLWEGLGYYNRVRNMQKAAQMMIKEYGGMMPDSYETMLTLPGIGPYTAGAICSISYDEPIPAVDGNVLRILSRVTEDDSDITKNATKNLFMEKLRGVMPKEAGNFNQSLMEIGALICLPNGMPRCEACPWQKHCEANRHQTYADLPVKPKKKGRRIEKKTVLIIMDGEKLLLGKRPNRGLLAGLYELPNVSGEKTQEWVLSFVKEQGLAPLHIQPLPEEKHIFSHVEWHMRGYMVRVADVESFQGEYQDKAGEYLLVDLHTMQREYAIPSAFSAYVSRLNITLGAKKTF